MRENLKNKHRIKNVIWSDKTLMHEAERPSIFFFFTILSHIIRLSR